MVRVLWFAFAVVCLLVSGCSRAGQGPSEKTYQVKGIVISVNPGEKTVKVKHEEITNYMPAMTMTFEVKNTNELTGLQPGDAVSFRMLVTEDAGWIDTIRKINIATTNRPPTSGPFRLVREVPRLELGDTLPEYHLTNQFGRPISTTQFKGQALAITFLFTRCPFPTFCPLMANRFAEAQQKLLAMPNLSTNWHLLTVSFDPDFDKPEILKAYAERYKYAPAHSTYATGALIDVTALGEQVGLTFWKDDTGSISHNLRTVVFDRSGRLQKIFTGNQWSAEELVEELVKATK